MKFGWKKIRSISLLGSTLLLSIFPLLSACSSNKGPDPGSPAGPTSEQTASPTDSTQTTTPHDPVTLKVLTWFVGPNQKLFDKFHEKYPWITIEANTKINGGIIKNVIAGDEADLLFLDNGLSEWMSGDLLEELTPYVKKDSRIQNANKTPNLLESFQTGGKQWTIPYSDIPMFIVVNTDLMKKYGMEMPSNNWTYNDMLEMAKKATNSSANDWGMVGMTDEFTNILSMANGSSVNYRYMDKDSAQSLANTPQVMDDLKWSQELTTRWHVRPSDDEMKNMGMPSDPGEAFLKGNFLFMLGADWYLEGLQKANFNWDILPMPKGTKQQATVHQAGLIAIPKSSKHKEEAFLYISFLFDVEAQKVMIENGDNAFVKDPELDKYYDQVPVWKGKNVEAMKMSANMCCYSSDARTVNLGTLVGNINGPIAKMIANGGDFSTLIPKIEDYNKKAIETRKALGW